MTTASLSILVADPYRLTLDSIRETLDASEWVEVLGEALTGPSCWAR